MCFYVVKVNDVSLGHKKRENTRDIHLSSTSQLFYDKKKKNSRFSHSSADFIKSREKRVGVNLIEFLAKYFLSVGELLLWSYELTQKNIKVTFIFTHPSRLFVAVLAAYSQFVD